MLKTIIKLQNGVVKVKENAVDMLKERLTSNEGIATVEVILLVIIIAGVLVALGIAFDASFAKWTASFDTIITDKINAVK